MLAILAGAADAFAFAKRLEALTTEMRPDGMTRARSFLEAVEDYTEDIPEHHISPIVHGLLLAGDALNKESDARGMFDFGNDIRVMRVFLQLVRRLDAPARERTILAAFRAGTALGTMLDVLRRAAQDNGLYGIEREDSDEPPLVDGQTTEAIASVVLDKIRRESAHDWSLAADRRLPYILSWWRELAGDSEPQRWIADLIKDDDALLQVLDRLTRTHKVQTMTSNYVRERKVIDPEDVARFADVDMVMARARQMLDRADFHSEGREILGRLLRGKRIRDAGRDPRRADYDEDVG